MTTIRVATTSGIAYLVPTSIDGILVRELDGDDDHDHGRPHVVELLLGGRTLKLEVYTGIAGANEYAAQLRRELDDTLDAERGTIVDATLEDTDELEVLTWAGSTINRRPRLELAARTLVDGYHDHHLAGAVPDEIAALIEGVATALATALPLPVDVAFDRLEARTGNELAWRTNEVLSVLTELLARDDVADTIPTPLLEEGRRARDEAAIALRSFNGEA